MKTITLDEILDIQERGMRDFLLERPSEENPFHADIDTDDNKVRRSAWQFGWQMEDASRQARLTSFLRKQLADYKAAREES